MLDMRSSHKVGISILILALAYIGWAIARPLPVLKPVLYTATQTIQSEKAKLKWPSYGGQAVGVSGIGVLATHGNQKAQPTASVAKVMVALAVLNKKPLTISQDGPLVPITKADVTIYKNGLATYQSGVAVQTGEKITEYQALQALLIASANNIAQTLTNWVFGSQKQYLDYANSYALSLGMKHAHFADASGLSAKTLSTPSDLVLLGEEALKNPVIAQIVAIHSANIPVAGVVKNFNANLTNGSNINGIKTGNTTEAGGVFLFSLNFAKNDKLVGVIMNAPTLGTALVDSVPLSKSLVNNVVMDNVISAGQKFAYYRLPWGGRIDATADQDLGITHLKGDIPKIQNTVGDLHTGADQKVGTVKFEFAGHGYETTISANAPGPSLLWRLMHP